MFILQCSTELKQLAQIRGQDDHVRTLVSLLFEVADHLEDHLGLVRVLLRRRGPCVLAICDSCLFILRVGMVDKDNVRLNTTDVGPVLCTRVVNELRIGQLPDERRDLRSHTVLRRQGLMRELLQYEAFKERSIKIEPFPLFDRQLIAIDFRTKLSAVGRNIQSTIRGAKLIRTCGHQ